MVPRGRPGNILFWYSRWEWKERSWSWGTIDSYQLGRPSLILCFASEDPGDGGPDRKEETRDVECYGLVENNNLDDDDKVGER